MLSPRYTQIATFMRTPLVTEYSDLDIALVGVPFDGGVSNRTGARQGPGQIREMSRLIRPVHHVTRFNPYDPAGNTALVAATMMFEMLCLLVEALDNRVG